MKRYHSFVVCDLLFFFSRPVDHTLCVKSIVFGFYALKYTYLSSDFYTVSTKLQKKIRKYYVHNALSSRQVGVAKTSLYFPVRNCFGLLVLCMTDRLQPQGKSSR